MPFVVEKNHRFSDGFLRENLLFVHFALNAQDAQTIDSIASSEQSEAAQDVTLNARRLAQLSDAVIWSACRPNNAAINH